MSDFNPHSTPDVDPSRHPDLPSRRPGADGQRPPADVPAEPISLEAMMERLQRSGESRSGESRSGRRRRSSQDRRSSSSSPTEDPENALPSRTTPPSARPRTVLPQPRVPDLIPAAASTRPRRAPEARRSHKWRYALLGLAFLTAAAWFGLRQLNRWRIEGEGFRVNAARRLSELADRRVSVSRFRQTGSDQLGNASLTFLPVHQDLLQSATFTDLSAQFAAGSWLADEWTIQSLRLQRADFAFLPGKKMDAQSLVQTAPAPVDRGLTGQDGLRLGITSDPTSIVFEDGRFDELNLTWPGPEGKPESLTQLEGNFRSAGDALLLEMNGGLLDTAAWPPFPVRQVNAKLRGTTLEIISARLGFTAEHEVHLSGSADLQPNGRLQLQADISPILLKHLLPEAWTDSVLGSFDASAATWLSHFQSGPPPTLSGPFRVRGLVLRGLPFIDKIATLLRKPDLTLLEFPTLTGQFAWTPQNTRLSNLSAATANGLLRFQGDITVVPGDAVSGQLAFEANDAFFAGLPPGASSLFSASKDGWRTLTFSLGGNDSALTDTIGIANPIVINQRPAVPALRVPRPDLLPATAPAVAPRPAPSASPTAPPLQAQPFPAAPPPPKPPSDADLERRFNQLLGR